MVADQRLTQVLTEFSATVVGEFSVADVLHQLARGAVQALAVDGAGVMVPDGEGLMRFAFAVGPADAAVSTLEGLQEQLQAGPCRDSLRFDRTIDVADLAAEGDWPSFQARAVQSGLRAVTALPMRARGRTWGVLDLYRAEPRRLEAPELAAARVLADVATSYLVVTADRDAARNARQELAFRAMHDPLTGIPVRWVFLEQLSHALARLARHPGQVGVIFVDLDGLKYVNDTYGHDRGDRLLVTCVERIRAALRPTDVVARVGGDEFVVLLEDLDGPEAGETVARRILAELAQPYRPDGQVLQPSASLGLALTADPAQTPETLIAHADSAMYRAKRSGPGRYETFDAVSYAADRARAASSHDATAALRSALRNGELTLRYQPIVDLTSPPASPGIGDKASSGLPTNEHGGVYAVEALARWRHPDHGLLDAQEFIPQAQQAGLMLEVGAWVLSTACHQLAAWDRVLGDRAPRRLFVNVSVDELTGPQFARNVAAVLREAGVTPDRLTLEITETGLISDPPAATASLQELRSLGCHVAIDDFGTGYSSLSRLVDLPPCSLKIDKSFTADLSSRPTAIAVVSAVLQLGRQLGRTVVVEGVEDEPTLQALRELGCTHVQGYHLGRPLPPEQISGVDHGP